MEERDEILWTLQPRDNEILGELNLAEESPMLKAPEPDLTVVSDDKASDEKSSGKKDEEGYDSDDSFQPPARERR